MSAVYDNQSLFSDHFLADRLRDNVRWQRDISGPYETLEQLYGVQRTSLPTANEAQTEDSFIKPVLADVLGWHPDPQWETQHQGKRQVPDYALFATTQKANDAKALRDDPDAYEARVDAVAEAKYWGRPLDGVGADPTREELSNANPSFQIINYMTATHRDWGILTNGQTWRLYSAEARSRIATYYEVDLVQILEHGDVDDFRWFYFFFSATSHRRRPSVGRSFVEQIYDRSEAYAAELQDQLTDLIFDDIFPRLAGGFLEQTNSTGVDGHLADQIYHGSLRLLYRLLFLLHAESRALLPVDDPAYRRRSLQQIKQEVADDIDARQMFGETSTGLWRDLRDLFDIIDRGDSQLNVPRYNGGLFSADNPDNDFFDAHSIADAHLAPAIDRLARAEDAGSGRRQFVDYKALDVEQLGSIYEGLLEFRLVIDDGAPVLENDKGERRATGSYYTPQYVVEYIVEESLRPALDGRIEAFDRLMAEVVDIRNQPSNRQHELADYEQRAVDALLDFKICDPAMGSGHFLVEAVDWLTEQLISALNEYPDNPLLSRLDDIRREILDSLDRQEVAIDEDLLKDTNLLKRLVMKRCIFGVDLNPMAVELTKLSLWLDSFTIGAPLSFLDHHLRPGNSLLGVQTRKVTAEIEGDLFGSAFAGMLRATELMQEVADTTDATFAEVEQSGDRFDKYRSAMRPYKRLLDCYVAGDFNEAAGRALVIGHGAAVRNALQDDQRDQLPDDQRQTLDRVDDLRRARRFFHWELEFPEVFFDLDRAEWKANPGFDAIVGNPPYVRMEQFKDLKEFLAANYDVHADRTDLYGYFLEQALSLIADDGQLGYIVSNKWMRANYGEPIRQHLLERASVRRMVDFRDLPVFKDARTYPMILIVSRRRDADLEGVAAVIPDLNFTDLAESVDEFGGSFTQAELHEAGWALIGNPGFPLLARLRRDFVSLAEYVGSPPLRGIVSGCNDAFVIDSARRDELIAQDPNSAEVIHPVRTGRDIRRYWMKNADTFLIYTHHGIDIDRYPAIEAHLEPFRDRLEGRATDQAWYELQQPQQAYRDKFEQPKIVQPDLAEHTRFYIDDASHFLTNTAYCLPTDESYLLAVLNSRVAEFCLSSTSAKYRGGYMRLFGQYVEKLPILHVDSLTQDREHDKYVEDLMDAYGEATDRWLASDTVADAITPVLSRTDDHLNAQPPRADVLRDLLAELAERMTDLHDRRRRYRLRPLGYLGERCDGPRLPDVGIFQPSADPGPLDETTATRSNLRISRVDVQRRGDTVIVEARARFKPDEPADVDTDQYGYTETTAYEAFRLAGVSDEQADLVEAFVPAVVNRGDGTANFRNTAAKSISPLDRLAKLTLPDLGRIRDDLHRFTDHRAAADRLDQLIILTDHLIDQIVYRLYGLSDQDIAVVEGVDG